MRELRLPLPDIDPCGNVSIKVKTDNKQEIEYRLEQFCWEDENSENSLQPTKTEEELSEIFRLKQKIENYDKEWELIQIFAPDSDTRFVKVLFRKK